MKSLNALDPDISVDYLSHPGFSSLSRATATSEEDDQIRDVFSRIDEVCELVTDRTTAVSSKTVDGIAERMLVPLFVEIIAASLKAIPDPSELKPALPGVFAKTRDSLVQQLHFRNGAKEGPKRVADEPRSRSAAEDLRKHGISMHQMSKADRDVVWSLTAPARQKLTELRATNPHDICGTPLPHSGECWDVVSQVLTSAGFVDGLALHYGYQMAPCYLTLVHSYPGETWYKGCYEDVGLTTGKCTYMHYDHADDMPKALIYVGEVGPQNGPFSIIPGSNDWHPSHAQGLFFKFLDRLGEEICRKEAGTDPYHRPQFKSRSFRAEFARLPRALQGSSHFGDDVVDGTALSDFLLGREFRITSDVSNCTLFSGHSTVHRGGLVDQGERWAFQIGFRKT